MSELNKNIKELLSQINNKGFFHLLSANFLIQIVAFASQLFVAGILSAEDIGRIKIIQTFLSIFSIVAGMGINASVLKLCSENRTDVERSSILRVALKYTLISTILFYILILGLNHFSVLSKDMIIKQLIPIGLFPLITNSLFLVYIAYYQAKKQIKLISGLTITNKVISILGIIALTFWFGIKGYYIAYNLSFIFMILVIFIRIRREATSENDKNNRFDFRLIWKFARPSFIAVLFAELSAYIDILLISYMVTDMHEIGQYGFALTLTVALRIFPSSVQQIASPYISGFSGTKSEFKKIFVKYNRLLYIVVGVTLLLALLLIPPFINLVFGSKYNGSVFYFSVLAIGWSIRQLTQLQSSTLFGLGKINYNAYVVIISLAFNMTLYPVLIYFWGLQGAALGSIFSGIVILLVSRFFLQKAMKTADFNTFSPTVQSHSDGLPDLDSYH